MICKSLCIYIKYHALMKLWFRISKKCAPSKMKKSCFKKNTSKKDCSK